MVEQLYVNMTCLGSSLQFWYKDLKIQHTVLTTSKKLKRLKKSTTLLGSLREGREDTGQTTAPKTEDRQGVLADLSRDPKQKPPPGRVRGERQVGNLGCN